MPFHKGMGDWEYNRHIKQHRMRAQRAALVVILSSVVNRSELFKSTEKGERFSCDAHSCLLPQERFRLFSEDPSVLMRSWISGFFFMRAMMATKPRGPNVAMPIWEIQTTAAFGARMDMMTVHMMLVQYTVITQTPTIQTMMRMEMIACIQVSMWLTTTDGEDKYMNGRGCSADSSQCAARNRIGNDCSVASTREHIHADKYGPERYV